MRGLGDLLAKLVLGGGVVLAALTVARDGAELAATGGWFAVLGQFLAVLATLAVLGLLAALAVALALLPLLLYFGLADPERHERLTLTGALVAGTRALGATSFAAANRVWKLSWWTCWWLGQVLGLLAPRRRRPD